MIPALIALGVGSLFVLAYWDEIVDWLKDFTSRLAGFFSRLGGHAAKIFSRIKGAFLQVIHRLFFKEDQKWIEETTRREVPESEVPEWAKRGVQESEQDVTQRYQQELQLTL